MSNIGVVELVLVAICGTLAALLVVAGIVIAANRRKGD